MNNLQTLLAENDFKEEAYCILKALSTDDTPDWTDAKIVPLASLLKHYNRSATLSAYKAGMEEVGRMIEERIPKECIAGTTEFGIMRGLSELREAIKEKINNIKE